MEMFKQNYGITIRECFTTVKVRDYFSLKCRTPTPLLANVVCKFQCLRVRGCLDGEAQALSWAHEGDAMQCIKIR